MHPDFEYFKKKIREAMYPYLEILDISVNAFYVRVKYLSRRKSTGCMHCIIGFSKRDGTEIMDGELLVTLLKKEFKLYLSNVAKFNAELKELFHDKS